MDSLNSNDTDVIKVDIEEFSEDKSDEKDSENVHNPYMRH